MEEKKFMIPTFKITILLRKLLYCSDRDIHVQALVKYKRVEGNIHGLQNRRHNSDGHWVGNGSTTRIFTQWILLSIEKKLLIHRKDVVES